MAKRILIKIGDILKEEYLEPLNISQYRLAKEIGVSNTLISKIINGKASVSADISYRLSLFFDTSVEYWINLQNLCDLDEVKSRYENKPIVVSSYRNFMPKEKSKKKLA
jgi:addiction module HigA family antidote